MYKGKTKKFRDTIHGYIDIPDIIVSNIIDTEQFQRLRYIEQTSMRSLYPAARHDRFIHSLGVYWLGRQAFQYFRQNSQEEFLKGKLKNDWWNKQELLFSLACLLHDCAHAPFSHTLENMYALREVMPGVDEKLGLDKTSRIVELDWKLLEVCKQDAEFAHDFLRGEKTSLGAIKGEGKPHEKMSSYCVVTEYKKKIENVCKAVLKKEIGDEDIVFIVRMIIGCTYSESKGEKSVKNCIISMLNSSSIDVDGLDYIVRDAYMSGIDNFSIDYQRLLSSFVAIPVKVFDGEEVEDMDMDGIWLKGTKLKIERFEARSVLGKLTIQGLNDIDQNNIKGLNCVIYPQQSVCATKLDDEIKIDQIRSGVMQLSESCRLYESKFSGIIEQGKMIADPLPSKKQLDDTYEYILGYDKRSLSIIQSTIEARNHEYLWVFAHPKVLYSSVYLQCELLKDSAKYLCCMVNNKQFDKSKLTFKCEGCKCKDVEEDYLLYIMGYNTYFNTKIGDTLRAIACRKLCKKGFVFYRTCDDDLIALFKRIYRENTERDDLKSDKIESDFREFFSRNHKKPLWKSFVEYNNFLNMCNRDADAKDVIPRFCKNVMRDSKIYEYAIPSQEQQEIFKKYEMSNVVVIKSSVNTKNLSPNETFIKFENQVFRLCDIYDKEILKGEMSKDIYYIFANMGEKLDSGKLVEMVKELDS